MMNGIDLSPVCISLKTAAAAGLIAFGTGVAAARWMTGYQGRGKSLIDGILIMPLVLPPTVVGFGLLLVFGRNGFFGRLLWNIGVSVVFSWPATVIAAAVVAFPLMYQTALGAFEQIDPNIENAARTLGLSEWTIFWHITVPLAWPGILAGAVLSFSRALGEFGATLMLAGNIPGKTQTIPIAIYFAAAAGNMEKALAWVAVIVVVSLFSIVSLNLWKRRGNCLQTRKL